MSHYSYLHNADGAAIEDLYLQYQNDPQAVDEGWRRFFEGYEFAKPSASSEVSAGGMEMFEKENSVINLIGAYRQRGHLFAKTNPVRPRRKHEDPIELSRFGLGEADLDTIFQAGNRVGKGPMTLRAIIEHMEKTYCGTVGVEYKFIRMRGATEWLEQKMESCRNTPNFSIDEKKHILHKLNQAVIFENFLHTKFVGQKRFSLEGAEAIIPALDAIVERGADLGIEEFVIGMAHRGRLNVLANILDKTYDSIFNEFEGKTLSISDFEGDVKYHLGFSNDKLTENGKKVHLSLTPNPSHLEAVNPVVEGIVRAKADFRYQGDFSKIAPILIHGDASIAGQGIIYEVLQMSLLDGYKTGGTIHVVLNNQIGFTTNFLDARSSTYCTDVAKTTLSPVFHVNGDDVEAVVYVIQLALEFRQLFKRDVFVDIVCYRKHGHNEGDEPRFTQPILYNIIANHPNPREIYNRKLIENGSVEADLAQAMEKEFRQTLQERLDFSKQQSTAEVTSFLQGNWKGLRRATSEDFLQSPDTGVDKAQLLKIAETLYTVPEHLKPRFFQKIVKLLEDRYAAIQVHNRLDWGLAEQIAYGSLLCEQHPVRLSGQDVERGTFSHRHSVIKLVDSEEEYIPLEHLSSDQAPFYVYNSLLSEYGVLGFELGYAMAMPKALTIWEAQFGDFANGAQIIIDQFFCCSETKWQRMHGLVLSLPHGYEGQGPEHSSARLERFLELCANDNIHVTNLTTPANLFHALRRQVKRDFRKPLVQMSPKSLLRHPLCVSPLEDFLPGTRFQEVYDDAQASPKSVKRLLFCSGKIYYDLLARQQKDNRQDVAIVRLEQLYPLPLNQLEAILEKYKHAKHFFWVQEEAENMGAWSFILRKFRQVALEVVCRRESSIPGTGFTKSHQMQQQDLVDRAFA